MYLKKIALGTIFSLSVFASCAMAQTETSQGLTLDIPNNIFPLLRIETSTDANSIFRVSELASIESAKKMGENAYGAGWIFSISVETADSMHKLLQNDTSGMDLFAYKDGKYYFYNHPTDVRYMRETGEIMRRDQHIWTKVNDWGYKEVRQKFIEDNKLTPITADNTDVGIALAKIMYDKNANATLTSLKAGKFKTNTDDAQKYLHNLLYDSQFTMTHEKPNGEYFVLKLPKDKITLKFFYGENKKNYVERVYEDFKPIVFKGEHLYVKYTATEIAKLYQALADKANKPTTKNGNEFIGAWHESIAGRGHIEISSAGNNLYKIKINWGESAFATSYWTMTAEFKNGALVYKNAEYQSIVYNKEGVEKVIDHYKDGKGEFKILPSGELIWNDITGALGDQNIFLRD